MGSLVLQYYCSCRTWAEGSHSVLLLRHSGRKLSLPVTSGLKGEQSLHFPQTPFCTQPLSTGPHLALKVERTDLRAVPPLPVLPRNTDFKDEECGVGTGTSGTGKGHGILGAGVGLWRASPVSESPVARRSVASFPAEKPKEPHGKGRMSSTP